MNKKAFIDSLTGMLKKIPGVKSVDMEGMDKDIIFCTVNLPEYGKDIPFINFEINFRTGRIEILNGDGPGMTAGMMPLMSAFICSYVKEALA